MCTSPTSALSNQVHLFVCCLFTNHFQVCRGQHDKNTARSAFFFLNSVTVNTDLSLAKNSGYTTDTAVIEYRNGMIERWVQLCVDNNIYEVCGHHWIASSSTMSSECSLTLTKTRSLPQTRRHVPKDLLPCGFQMFVE